MNELVLERFEPNVLVMGTLGSFVGLDIYTLERPWRDNVRGLSCIPCGHYPMRWGFSHRFQKNYWHIDDVPGRDGILIHRGNYLHDTTGCILVGNSHHVGSSGATVNQHVLEQSTAAYSRLLKLLGTGETQWALTVRNAGSD